MKKWLFLVGLAALFLHGAHDARAAVAEELFTKVKINLSSSNPPNIRNTSNTTPSASTSWRNKWLIISVDYTPVAPQKMRSAWIDDASMSVRAVFNGQSDGKTQAFLFSGKSMFRAVPLDNRKHIVTMMIPPQLLDRYLPSSGSASTVNLGSTFTIEVLFQDRAGTVIGRGYYGQRGWSDLKYADYFTKLNAGAAVEIPGSILPRNETPWAFMDIDDYDLLKSGGASQPGQGGR
ncbi:MAG: hypothetical protein HPZ91_01460 [Lentisphaeria bacterium]|nr:hypothetical protein [Lentisphaeria bacterium]